MTTERPTPGELAKELDNILDARMSPGIVILDLHFAERIVVALRCAAEEAERAQHLEGRLDVTTRALWLTLHIKGAVEIEPTDIVRFDPERSIIEQTEDMGTIRLAAILGETDGTTTP